jgi:hypothetical protein
VDVEAKEAEGYRVKMLVDMVPKVHSVPKYFLKV